MIAPYSLSHVPLSLHPFGGTIRCTAGTVRICATLVSPGRAPGAAPATAAVAEKPITAPASNVPVAMCFIDIPFFVAKAGSAASSHRRATLRLTAGLSIVYRSAPLVNGNSASVLFLWMLLAPSEGIVQYRGRPDLPCRAACYRRKWRPTSALAFRNMSRCPAPPEDRFAFAKSRF